MPNKALIINPWITDFKLYDEWMHPLGLYFLISLLKHNNWDISYINCLDRSQESKSKRYGTGTFPAIELQKPRLYRHIHRKYKRYGISEEQLINTLTSGNTPGIIFIGSGMTYWIDGVVATVKQVREIFPKTPVVIGGISATLIPEIINAYLPDSIIYSGALFSDLRVLQKIHLLLKDIASHGWLPTLSDAFTLIKNPFHGPLLTSFGCPLHCSYCASSHLQKKLLLRPHESVIDEMRYCIEKRGVVDFACYDDALLFQSEKHFLPLANKIQQLGSDIRIHVPNGLHIRWLDKKNIESMKVCGFVTLRFGYESSSIKHTQDTNAKADRNELEEKTRLIKAAGFSSKDIGVYIMAGLPDQTVEDVIDELSFIASLGIQVKPVFLSPVPHTKLFNYYTETLPQLTQDPLFHNDTFFITQLPGWGYDAMEEVKGKAQELNREIVE